MDYKAKFDDLSVIILGISRDKTTSNKKFKENLNLDFDLLSDTESEVCSKFGILAEKSMFGKKYMGIVRTTLIFDESGELVKTFKNVKITGHAEEVYNCILLMKNI